jgi:hypothetical protein
MLRVVAEPDTSADNTPEASSLARTWVVEDKRMFKADVVAGDDSREYAVVAMPRATDRAAVA